MLLVSLILPVFVTLLTIVSSTSAVTYQSSVDVSFTFNPTISINLSSDTASTDLIINNLTPGSTADSNTLTVSVTTNATYGYYLTATAGTSSTNTDLVNTENSNYKFTSIATNASLASLSTDNTWGYRISDDNGSTWSNYSGLPKDNDDDGATGKALIETTSPVDNQSIKFKIGAKASTAQAAGTYTNVITFYAVTSPEPEASPVTPPTSCTTPVPNLTYMQDLNSSNKASILAGMTTDAQYYLADKRDDKTYCVAKLRDGNIWMTQNLDHDIETDGSVAYNSTTTDLPANTTWIPSAATKATSDTSWSGSGSIPESYNPGELYWSGFLVGEEPDTEETCTSANGTWNSEREYCEPISTTGDSHYHLGNYYKWAAAVAVNDSSSYTTQFQDINQSICPANWTLPKSGNNASNGSFQYLVSQYNWNSGTNKMENPNIWDTAIKSVLSGDWYGFLEFVGDEGVWWSSVVWNSGISYILSISPTPSGSVGPAYGNYRYFGFSVRCLSR